MTVNGYISNEECILDYLALFQNLSSQDADPDSCREHWNTIQLREEATPSSVPLAPQILRWKFELEELEFLLCMAALALEMDGGLRQTFRRQYGLQLPTLEYGLQLIRPLADFRCETLAIFFGENPLTELLMKLPGEVPGTILEYPLLLCNSLVSFLTGLSAAYVPGFHLMEGEEALLPLYQTQGFQIQEWYEEGGKIPICLCGSKGSGRRSLVIRCLGGLVYGDWARVSIWTEKRQIQTLREVGILVRLTGLPLCVELEGVEMEPPFLRPFCREWNLPLILLFQRETGFMAGDQVVRLPRQLDLEDRKMVWEFFAPDAQEGVFPAGRVTVGTVKNIAALARRSARRQKRDTFNDEDLRQALFQYTGSVNFGIQYEVTTTLEDMVLPEHTRQKLEQICQAARWEDTLSQWELSLHRGGVAAVFHGPSGTGKTMAAAAIAHALGRPLLRADLSRLMDKYVGETEKHLGQLFRSARENNCILLFDEADSLFGKRTGEVSEQNKYANLSTSFLLQEMEEYDGVALLSTNLLGNFDNAFLRRLQYVVKFPLPDAKLREQLWRRTIPVRRQGEKLPFEILAKVEISPARIQSVVRCSAVRALSEEREEILIRDLAWAMEMELEKSGKSLPLQLKAELERECSGSEHNR